MIKKLLIAVVVLILCVPVYLWYRARPLHTDLNGPLEKSEISKEVASIISDFSEERTPDSLALVVVNNDSRWPDLRSVLKTHGIPVSLYSTFEEAKNHKVIFVYPSISGKLFSAESLEGMKTFVKNGGTLIATNVFGGGLQEVFGFRAVTEESTTRKEIIFSGEIMKFSLGSVSYTEPNKTLASFGDGSSAIIENNFGKGHGLLFGFDLGDLAYLSSSGRGEELASAYVNQFVTGIDPLMKFVKTFYREHQPNPVTLGTVPFNKDLTMLITHDVDFQESVKHALVYAREEDKVGVQSTFFIQTKYVNDFGDEIFFRDSDIRNFNRIKRLGMEIASHSVSHSRQFNKFEVGTGEEKYPDYAPFNESWSFTKQGTVFGELRVSKFLLDQKVKDQKTVSFRAGELKDPEALPQALAATGFAYDSTGTSGSHLTNFPIHLTYNRRGKAYVNVFRFPVTIEDEKVPPLEEWVKQSNDNCEKVASLRGVCTILVHPNVREHKLDFVKAMIAAWRERAHFSTVKDFGDWWSTRDQLKINVSGNTIDIKSKHQMKGLPLELPNGKTRVVDLEEGMNRISF